MMPPRAARMPDPPPLNLYMSRAIEGDIAHLLGAPHYSYHFAAERFARMLTRHKRPPVTLAMPEYYADAAALPAPWGANVHLIFRSTEQIRLLKPAVNIACFAWEFPVLKTDTLPGEHPFANQRAMLSLCDEVWTPSAFACGVLAAHGVAPAYRIPAPVAAPAGGRADRELALERLAEIDAVTADINFAWPPDHQDLRTAATATSVGRWLAAHGEGSQRPIVFLSVLNPEDFRKNLDAMVRGFHQVRRTHPRAVLLIKTLTSGRRFTLAQVGGGVVRNKLAPGTVLGDSGVGFINAYLSDEEMSLLYSLADFYLCTSVAEGQNLPLLEAMAHGTQAVTTRNTAMDDYVTTDNAVVIESRPVENDTVHLAGTIAQRKFMVRVCTARDVYCAACEAIAAGPDQGRGRERAKQGIATVARLFSERAVWALVSARLAYHAGQRAA